MTRYLSKGLVQFGFEYFYFLFHVFNLYKKIDYKSLIYFQHFQNVRKFELQIQTDDETHLFDHQRYCQKVLSQTVPYVPGIIKLDVHIDFADPPVIVWKDIIKKTSQLEELHLEYYYGKNVRHVIFDEQLDTSFCSKLRAVTLSKYFIFISEGKSI